MADWDGGLFLPLSEAEFAEWWNFPQRDAYGAELGFSSVSEFCSFSNSVRLFAAIPKIKVSPRPQRRYFSPPCARLRNQDNHAIR
jgi:hypothetical protein